MGTSRDTILSGGYSFRRLSTPASASGCLFCRRSLVAAIGVWACIRSVRVLVSCFADTFILLLRRARHCRAITTSCSCHHLTFDIFPPFPRFGHTNTPHMPQQYAAVRRDNSGAVTPSVREVPDGHRNLHFRPRLDVFGSLSYAWSELLRPTAVSMPVRR